MPLNVTATLRKALRQLETERQRLDRQIASIRAVLEASSPSRPRRRRAAPSAPAKKRRPMSAKARKALSQRMKAYWAKRKMAAKVKEKQGQSAA
jgi:hypothetical protein